jgi:glycosyltransferase involved in cell wall biosynthesis
MEDRPTVTIPKNSTICANMIVKDESLVIRRCLDSIRPFIDYWVIVDTGSTDATRDVIRDVLSDIPGELHERPWHNFGHNRSEALELARNKAEYTFIIDADEVLIAAPGFQLPQLTADEYQVRHEVGNGGHSFFLTQFVRSSLPWRYEGVLHEAIACDVQHSTARLDGLITRGHFDGARNLDPKKKYLADAALLETAVKSEPNNARYVFYLAQSYRDADELPRSVEVYERRAAMGGWAEEVWYSLFQVAVLRERLGHDSGTVVDNYLRAYQNRPTRAEPLCALARYYRERGQLHNAHLFSSVAAKLPRPDDILFMDDTVYDWRALDEYCVSSYWVGDPKDGLDAADRLLEEGKLPASERARIEENRTFCIQKLATRGSGSSAPQAH